MYKGIYIALTGAVSRHERIDAISQNIANANTVGFKQTKISFNDHLISQMNNIPWSNDGRAMTVASEPKIDFSGGEIIKTGNPFDIAINGRGFISLEGGMYTRKGDLKIDMNGNLITKSGIKVLGENGAIQIPKGKVEIPPSGDINVNGSKVAKLKIVDFEDIGSLIGLGDGLFSTNQEGIRSEASVEQGHIELSNVDIFKEMIMMMSTLRDFESYQKAIQTLDEATSKITNDMARI